MKQILQPFILVLLTILPTTALAHDFYVDGIYYNIVNGNEVTVTSGDNEYTGDVVIPPTVTYNGTTYSVTTIGSSAFLACSGLTSVNIPNSVTTIGNYAFCECSGLTSVTIPNSVTSIGNSAFWYCSGLTSITIPNSVTSIGEYAFWGCSVLDTLSFNAVSCADFDPGDCPFMQLNITTINIGDEVQKIPASFAYGLTKLSSVNFGNSVTSIGREAFYGCSGLTGELTIPNSVTSISDFAFNECSGLTSVNIPNSVTSISDFAFNGCSGLTSVNIPNSVTTIGNYAFCECSGLTSFIIPNSVTGIGHRAFLSCSGLTSVTIPNSVTSIGREAFRGCSSLTSVNISDIEAWCKISFSDDSNPLSYGHHLYLNGEEVTELVIPNSVTSIGEDAFCGCSSLTSVTIGNSVTSIGYYAFYGCNGLTNVTCLATTPPAINSNTYYAFPGIVTDQATLYVPEEAVAAYQTAYNWKNFSQIVGITEAPVIDDFEVDGVWYRAIDENTAMVISRPGEDELYSGDVVIPEAVTYEGYTFTVTAIDAGAFEDCFELNSVVIGDAVESIGENAFQGCTGLSSVTIGSGVTSIGAKAFNYCNALQTVTCRGTVPPVMANSNCFSNAAYSRAVLKVPRPEIETYAAADYWYKFSHIEGWGYLGPGDVNGDGVISMDDLTRLINIMVTDDLGGTDPTWADVNGNGMVNMNDLTALINLLVFGHQ